MVLTIPSIQCFTFQLYQPDLSGIGIQTRLATFTLHFFYTFTDTPPTAYVIAF